MSHVDDQPMLMYAPNVHTGGGFVLLQALLDSWPEGRPLRAVLAARARNRLSLTKNVQLLKWVEADARSRWAAERLLASVVQSNDTVFCFHGLPPLLRNPSRIVVFLQNRLYFGALPLSAFKARTAARLGVERLQGNVLRRRVTEYIVQTPSMARDLAQWYTKGDVTASTPNIRVLPFMVSTVGPKPRVAPEWDFVYVADGEAHKNHSRLLEAWRLLASSGLAPRLALTLSPANVDLVREVHRLQVEHGVHVQNLGQMSHESVQDLYANSGALIFPSLSESFGLPLLEAANVGLPVLAPELDYVRDVCVPAETFDPTSAVSIARAVRRFLHQPEPALKIATPTAFWRSLIEESNPSGH